MANLWPVLQPCITQPVTGNINQLLSQFCLRHEIAEADLGHVIKICRWIYKQAAAIDLPRDKFGEDLTTLWPTHEALRQMLAEHYEEVSVVLREQLLAEALVKHGNVLVDVDWRIDQVAAERNAPNLQAPVALITLAYRNSDRAKRLTLQITEEKLSRLTQVFGALAHNVGMMAKVKADAKFDAGMDDDNAEGATSDSSD